MFKNNLVSINGNKSDLKNWHNKYSLIVIGCRLRCRWATTADSWTPRQIIHHELFHLIDWENGSLYQDSEWEKLNPSNFKYGSGGISLQKPSDWTAGLPDTSLKGFLNRYSMSGLEEDKAEIFAHMMANYKAINSRAQTDPIIKAKMCQLKKLLYDFCPTFNEAFWSKIQAAPVLND